MSIQPFPTELYTVIILSVDQTNRVHIYRSLLSIPSFARTLTTGKRLDWMEKCGVNVRIRNYYNCRRLYIQWSLNGEIHNGGDQPALIHATGDLEWFKHNKRHRDGDAPAVIYQDGNIKQWYHYNEKHRDGDLPAVIYADGTQKWYRHGKLHRDGNMPAVVEANGTKKWYKDGKLHRDGDMPAVVRSNSNNEYWNCGTRYYLV